MQSKTTHLTLKQEAVRNLTVPANRASMSGPTAPCSNGGGPPTPDIPTCFHPYTPAPKR